MSSPKSTTHLGIRIFVQGRRPLGIGPAGVLRVERRIGAAAGQALGQANRHLASGFEHLVLLKRLVSAVPTGRCQKGLRLSSRVFRKEVNVVFVERRNGAECPCPTRRRCRCSPARAPSEAVRVWQTRACEAAWRYPGRVQKQTADVVYKLMGAGGHGVSASVGNTV